MANGALSDLRVVEIAESISGPYCTKLFADLGAEVIKVEKPQCGDITRRLGPFPGDIPHSEKSGLFIYLNTNKMGITLDIEKATGRNMLKALLRDADVLVESNPQEIMRGLELDYESLEHVNPHLIMTSITPFGHTGPYRDYKAYDISITAASGVACRLGFPDREPLSMPAYQGSYYAALTAAAATMVAVYARDVGHPGQCVDISQVRCWATTLSLHGTRFLTDQAVAVRAGREQPGSFPFNIIPVRDGMVVMICLAESEWGAIVDMMGSPEWAKDARFKTMYSRYEYREEIMTLMKPWLMSHTRAEILELGVKADALKVCMPLQTIDEIVKNRHLKERNFFVEVDHPEAGKLKLCTLPPRFTDTPWLISRRAPYLGEHNTEIYCKRLGYTESDLSALRKLGVI